MVEEVTRQEQVVAVVLGLWEELQPRGSPVGAPTTHHPSQILGITRRQEGVEGAVELLLLVYL